LNLDTADTCARPSISEAPKQMCLRVSASSAFRTLVRRGESIPRVRPPILCGRSRETSRHGLKRQHLFDRTHMMTLYNYLKFVNIPRRPALDPQPRRICNRHDVPAGMDMCGIADAPPRSPNPRVGFEMSEALFGYFSCGIPYILMGGWRAVR
jgi:hypothetical protein